MEKKPHILLEEKDVCRYVILPGDPARLDRIIPFLTDVKELAYNREYRSIKGTYKGVEIMALSTGIGGASTGIAIEELVQLGVDHMIRIGSAGALQEGMKVGDLVFANGAVRDDGASKAYVDSVFPAVADFELLSACKNVATDMEYPHHIGIVRSHDSFYVDEKEEIYDYWKKKGVIASDMETAALFVIGKIRNVKCVSILNVVVAAKQDLEKQINRYTDEIKETDQTGAIQNMASVGEKREILTALEAFVRIDSKTEE